jgi:hypothetical protein
VGVWFLLSEATITFLHQSASLFININRYCSG